MWFIVLLVANVLVASRAQSTKLETMMGLAVDERINHDLAEPSDRDSFDTSYDFVIVGAGAGGCVLANRLTENPEVTVLLIEAGQPEPSVTAVPNFSFYERHTDIDWDFGTEPDDNYCRAIKNGSCPWPVGKMMGGSTTINDFITTRGNRHDYDNWSALGNAGWDYNNTLYYFKKLENVTMDDLLDDEEYHGYDGPMRVEYAYVSTFGDAFIQAGGETGWPTDVDFNGAKQVGYSKPQGNVKDGARLSASRAYLHPIRNRTNLHVTKYSVVTKINFENSTAANGVTFEKDGESFDVVANKEVLISAGTIKSPQLLMLSGIGPEEHLTDLGISVVADLPVGENLHDHVALFGLTFDTNVTASSVDLDGTIDSWRSERNGTLSSLGVAWAYLDTVNTTDADGWSDIELILLTTDNNPTVFQYAFDLSSDAYDDLFPQPSDSYYMLTILPMLLRPKSSGVLLLRDTDPKSKPKIYPNYWNETEDIETIIRGVRQIQALANTTAFGALNATLRQNGPRNCTQTFMSDEYIECLAREVTISISHYTGTCSMGSVVDETLKVKGITGLRVVDASVMPEVPAGHTMIPTLMVAERAADLIKNEWNL